MLGRDRQKLDSLTRIEKHGVDQIRLWFNQIAQVRSCIAMGAFDSVQAEHGVWEHQVYYADLAP